MFFVQVLQISQIYSDRRYFDTLAETVKHSDNFSVLLRSSTTNNAWDHIRDRT